LLFAYCYALCLVHLDLVHTDLQQLWLHHSSMRVLTQAPALGVALLPLPPELPQPVHSLLISGSRYVVLQLLFAALCTFLGLLHPCHDMHNACGLLQPRGIVWGSLPGCRCSPYITATLFVCLFSHWGFQIDFVPPALHMRLQT
jgi:hypothetical protein